MYVLYQGPDTDPRRRRLPLARQGTYRAGGQRCIAGTRSFLGKGDRILRVRRTYGEVRGPEGDRRLHPHGSPQEGAFGHQRAREPDQRQGHRPGAEGPGGFRLDQPQRQGCGRVSGGHAQQVRSRIVPGRSGLHRRLQGRRRRRDRIHSRGLDSAGIGGRMRPHRPEDERGVQGQTIGRPDPDAGPRTGPGPEAIPARTHYYYTSPHIKSR